MSDLQRHRGDIQGLRALAVVPVVLFHADARLVPGGFLGVDVFFVISGYLISHILLREIGAGRFSIADFYVRRVRRLFPALYVVLAATLAAGVAILPPKQLADLGITAAGTILFVSNLVLLKQTNYFADAAELNPLLHTWSLAVEEQFYLLYPLLLFAVSAKLGRWLKPMLWVGAIGSLLLCQYLLRGYPSFAFYAPVTRACELLIGCIVAAGLPRPRSERVMDALSWLGLATIVAGFVLFDSRTPFPGITALVPCIGTALVLFAGERRTSAAGRLLAARPATFFGDMSYSLYLWHWPVLVYLHWITAGRATGVQVAAAVVGATVLAAASLRWVEQPVLRKSTTMPRVFVAGGTVMTAGLAICAVLLLAGGLPQRYDPSARAMLAAAQDYNPRRKACHSDEAYEVPYAKSCNFGAPGGSTKTIVWGDSFGAELAVALGERLRGEDRQVLEVTSSACPPSLGFAPKGRPSCAAHNARVMADILADRAATRVILVANYAVYRERGGPAAERRVLAGLARTAARLRAGGRQVELVYPIPATPFSVPAALAGMDEDARASFGTPSAEHRRTTASVRASLDAMVRDGGARAIDPADSLCAQAICRVFTPGVGALYFDDHHLSLTGARYVLRRAEENRDSAAR